MKFVGYACRHAEPPLREAYLPLGGLTVLLGPNDSGKSSLLRAVERDLRGGHYDAVSEDEVKHTGGVFFVEVSDRELGDLVRAAQRSDERVRQEPHRAYLGRRPPWALGGWRPVRLPPVDDKALKEDPAAGWLTALRDNAPESEHFDAVLDVLAESRLVGLEPAGTEDGNRVWNAFWCLVPLGELDGAVADALRSSPLRPFEDERRRREEEGMTRFLRSFFDAAHGRPRHLWVDGAPVVVAPIGQAVGQFLPRGLAVPEQFDVIRTAVLDAVNELTSAARHGLPDAQRDEPLDEREREERAVPRNWLEASSEGSYRVHPDARGACTFLAAAANRVLPNFIAERYRIEAVLRDLASWFARDPLVLRLAVRHDDSRQEHFAVDAVADGFRLWVQLALLEACEDAARAAGLLHEHAQSWWDHEEPVGHAYTEGREDEGDELRDQAAAYDEFFHAVRRQLHALAEGRREWVEGDLRRHLEHPAPAEWTRTTTRHRRYFVADEPERHLHPLRQREAAAWLARLSAEREAPCLVASHSTAFLSLPASGELSYIYVDRVGDSVRLQPFASGEMESLDEAVAAMGFDRGELLTTVALFLVVEGRHDEEVLSRAFRAELRAAHIALIPLDGVGAWRAVLDSHALWRYSSAAVAFATDRFSPEKLAELLADPEKLRALRRSDAPEETKALAKLMGTAQYEGKTIHLVGHRGIDLVDALDEVVIASLYPRYPGHAQAQARWQQERDAGAPAGQRKSFYEREFGVPNDVRAYEALGDAHAEAGIKPPALEAMVKEAVEVAHRAQP